MSERSEDNYIEIAREVLDELGGGPIASGDLVAAARERGLVGEGKWVYHSLLRKVREAEEFDTSQHGRVSFAKVDAVAVDAEIPSPEPEEDTAPEKEEGPVATVA